MNNPGGPSPPSIYVEGSTTITVEADITIQAVNGSGQLFGLAAGATLVNNGNVRTDGASTLIDVISLDVVNQGLGEAVNGGHLRFGNTTSLLNTGTLRAVGSSNVTANGLTTSSGLLRADAGSVFINNLTTAPGIDLETDNGGLITLGHVNNAGNTVTLDQADNSVQLQSGTWEGGMIAGPSALMIRNGARLKDVVVDANVTVLYVGGAPQFEDITLNGTMTVISFARLASNLTQTLNGTGQIDLNSVSGIASLVIPAGETLTLGPDITVRGTGSIYGGGTLVNRGTLLADVLGGYIDSENKYVQTATGSLDVSIAGVGTANYGFLRTHETADLDGDLHVSFAGSFTPTIGQSFLVVDNVSSDPITGTFAGLPEGAIFTAAGVSLQITYAGFSGNDVVVTVVDTTPPVITVDVDVKPGNSQNKVNAKSQGVIPIAIYTSDDFDAATIDVDSVRLAGTLAADHFALEDVDDDGDLDLILFFRTQDVLDALRLDLENGDSEQVDVELTGETVDEVTFQGLDTIFFFVPVKGKGKK